MFVLLVSLFMDDDNNDNVDDDYDNEDFVGKPLQLGTGALKLALQQAAVGCLSFGLQRHARRIGLRLLESKR